MGHQFFERLAGRWLDIFRFEIEQEEPDTEGAADAGAKTVHNRVMCLISSGDLKRIVTAVKQALSAIPASGAREGVPLPVTSSMIERLQACRRTDEAQRVAVALLGSVAAQRACTIDDAIRSAAQFFSEQVARSEAVYRLPRDGLLGMQDFATDLSARMASRVSSNLIRQRKKDPVSWTHGRLRAPRARARKPNSEEMGNALDLSKKSVR